MMHFTCGQSEGFQLRMCLKMTMPFLEYKARAIFHVLYTFFKVSLSKLATAPVVLFLDDYLY